MCSCAIYVVGSRLHRIVVASRSRNPTRSFARTKLNFCGAEEWSCLINFRYVVVWLNFLMTTVEHWLSYWSNTGNSYSTSDMYYHAVLPGNLIHVLRNNRWKQVTLVNFAASWINWLSYNVFREILCILKNNIRYLWMIYINIVRNITYIMFRDIIIKL